MHTVSDLQQIISDAFSGIGLEKDPVQLYEPITYTLELGGKRLRPLLTLMSCELFGGDIGKAIEPAMGVEIFHNFTLLHDDIMDRAPLRRGNQTVHEKWDINTAILSGDTMFVIAYEHVAKTDPAILPAVLHLFNDTARKVCEGQQFDMDYETSAHVSIPEYMNMIRLKTAVLLACSLKLGAIIAGAPEADADRIYDLGIELGLAFQLRDDYLDAFGNADKFGKAIGGDIAANKKTFLYIKAFELASGDDQARLAQWFSHPAPEPDRKIREILAIYRELGVPEQTRALIEHHHNRALAILQSFGFAGEWSAGLAFLMHEMLCREK